MRYLFAILMLLMLVTPSFVSPAAFTIKGMITDDGGNPVSNASIIIKGSNRSTVSAQDGSFSLKADGEKAVLIITAVGFDKKEITVSNNGQSVSIALTANSKNLQEVVVMRIGDKKKVSCDVLDMSAVGTAPGVIVNSGYERNARVTGGYNYNMDTFKKDDLDREGYDAIVENRFQSVTDNPLSTFSIDVDAASYSNIRRMLNMGQLPPAGSVRIEEMINYFHYDYPAPAGNDPFSINTEIAACPWNEQHKLVLIGLQGKKVPAENLPAANLVFLIDVSGSMMDVNKLPLVKQSMKLLVDQLRDEDKVAIVVYAGAAGVVLPSTSGEDKQKIKDAIDELQAGGSTAGGAGIQLAYKIAKENFVKNGNNRVLLCTDGDFNVGTSSDAALEELIEEKRKSGVFLTVLGYGTGNYQDAKMQKLADKGNGNHAYIDNFSEARKVLVSEFGGTLFTIAKDVKLQVEFNPAKVQSYRLIGYENRMLNKEDFNNDQKDAGEMGSGHTVTALYEVIPTGVKNEFAEPVDKLKYQQQNSVAKASASNEILTVKFRYKQPDGDKSKLLEHPVADKVITLQGSSANFRFAAAVAEFGMLLRNSSFKQSASFANVLSLAKAAAGEDEEGYRGEFIKLVKSAQSLTKRNDNKEEHLADRKD
ncbi:MAG: von Willebrand factor type A domain-containing protein [Chitinophagaceae bacterium]